MFFVKQLPRYRPLTFLRLRLLPLLAVLMAAAVPVSAQVTALLPDAWVDVQSGTVNSGGVILVEEGKVKAIQAERGALPEGAQILDLSGYTLLPGLIDMHTHLTSDPLMHGYRRLSRSGVRAAIKGVKHARDTLMAGVTTVRNVGAGAWGDVALRDAIADGDVPGPRMLVSGPSLGITGGHCDNNLLPPEYKARGEAVADGPWAVTAQVRQNIKYGADVIKFCATGGVLSKGTKVGAQQYSLEEMTALVEEAHRRGLTVAAHAHGGEGIRTAIEAGVDTVEHASFIDKETIRLALKKGTALSMDIYVTEYILGEGEKAGILPESLAKERMVGRAQRENFRAAVKAGVTMVMGTDAGVYPHGDNLKQLSRMVQFGMTPMQALQAASINAARVLGKDQEFGAIAAGLSADMIAVKGDPIQDIALLEQVAFVMKQGVVYKSE